MPLKLLPLLVGVGVAAAATSAFAFDAMVTKPTAMRTHASPRAAVIEVIPANAVIDMERCVRGWCEASYAGRVGFVYTPVLVSEPPAAPAELGPFGLIAAPVTAVGEVLDAAAAMTPAPASAPGSGPVVATY